MDRPAAAGVALWLDAWAGNAWPTPDDLGRGRLTGGSLARRRTDPGHVWSLHGLHECLTRLGRHEEAQQLALQRDIAVASADVPVGTSCFCALTAFEDDGAGCCAE